MKSPTLGIALALLHLLHLLHAEEEEDPALVIPAATHATIQTNRSHVKIHPNKIAKIGARQVR